MSEQLLSVNDIANKLRVNRSVIYRHLPKLKAKGLQQVPLSIRAIRFREASLDKLIARAADREEPLF